MKADTPATIPVAVMTFAAAIAPAAGYFFHIEPAGILVLQGLISGAAGLVVAIYLNRTTTSNSAPVVPAGTEVSIEGTQTTVTAEVPPQVGSQPVEETTP